MIALIALSTLVALEIPNGFYGIWADSNGQVLALLGGDKNSQMRISDFEYSIGDVGIVPSGDWVGKYAKEKYCEYPVAPPFLRASILEVGEFRVSPGRAWSDGSIHSLNVRLYNAHQTLRYSGLMDYKFGFDHVSFEGTYKSDRYRIDLEPSSDGRNYRGRFTYEKRSYIFQGQRSGIRMNFNLQDVNYNAIDGSGYLEWCPTSKRIDAISKNEASATDRIHGYFKIPGVLTNGGQDDMFQIN